MKSQSGKLRSEYRSIFAAMQMSKLKFIDRSLLNVPKFLVWFQLEFLVKGQSGKLMCLHCLLSDDLGFDHLQNLNRFNLLELEHKFKYLMVDYTSLEKANWQINECTYLFDLP